MIKEILDFINSNIKQQFVFKNDLDPVSSLKMLSGDVIDESGIYMVFSNVIINDRSKHLHYHLNSKEQELVYFGKAGGTTKSGIRIKQGLKGRINNVVSDSVLGFKDVRRAVYWSNVMASHKIDELTVLYGYFDEPQRFEDILYTRLDEAALFYPLMNKKRGRRAS